ncbi:MAG: DUF29 domain-containing protein [Ahrensia sp.]|nr:DUF29 domain-containing protein [Ahrensia sp.]
MSDAAEKFANRPLYERDYYAWTREQARALRRRDVRALDFENLWDEVEDLGKSERRAVLSRLEVLQAHLLKFLVQPEEQPSSWLATLQEQRMRLRKLLKANPSLQSLPADSLEEVHELAVLSAIRDTDLPFNAFPETSPFSVEQLLDDTFVPYNRLASR